MEITYVNKPLVFVDVNDDNEINSDEYCCGESDMINVIIQDFVLRNKFTNTVSLERNAELIIERMAYEYFIRHKYWLISDTLNSIIDELESTQYIAGTNEFQSDDEYQAFYKLLQSSLPLPNGGLSFFLFQTDLQDESLTLLIRDIFHDLQDSYSFTIGSDDIHLLTRQLVQSYRIQNIFNKYWPREELKRLNEMTSYSEVLTHFINKYKSEAMTKVSEVEKPNVAKTNTLHISEKDAINFEIEEFENFVIED